MMTSNLTLRLVAAILILAANGCSARSQAEPAQSGRVHLVGQLVDGGAECQRFKTFDEKYYTLQGDLKGFRTGDTVEITGTIPKASHCMQDTPVQVETIRSYSRPK